MNKLLVLPNHAEQFHLMKLYFILDVSLELYQLMKVLTPVLDKVAKKAFRPFLIIVFNPLSPIISTYKFSKLIFIYFLKE